MEARCPLGEALGESCKDTSLRSLSTEEMDLALLRAGHAVSELCYHHWQAYIKLYSRGQKRCCDLLDHHPEKSMTRSCRVINQTMEYG